MNAHITDYTLSEPISGVPKVITRGFCVNLIWARGTQGGLLAVVAPEIYNRCETWCAG